jgi:drug/metabolite transporter (DMT)-like permease
MLEFLHSIVSLFSFGTNTAVSKKAIHTASRYQAIVYMYIVLSILLVVSSFVFGVELSLSSSILPLLIFNIVVGAIAVIAMYKGLEQGKASIIGPLAKSHVLLVILVGVLFFGEDLTITKAFGSLIILGAAAIISFEGTSLNGLRLERGIAFLLITIGGRSIYYSLLKPIVAELGPFLATFYLEIGITAFVLLYAIIRAKNTSLPNSDASRFILANGFLVFIGSMMYNFSVEAIGIVLTAIILSATPVVNLVASRFILAERIPTIKYIAVVLLVIGLIVLFGF